MMIYGLANAGPEQPARPAQAPVQADNLYRAKMKIAGSTCVACQKELERALLKIKGIRRVRIEKPPRQIILSPSPDLADWSECTVIFDKNVMTLNDLKAAFKANGYHAYKMSEKPLESGSARP